jgi:hypothetical protein
LKILSRRNKKNIDRTSLPYIILVQRIFRFVDDQHKQQTPSRVSRLTSPRKDKKHKQGRFEDALYMGQKILQKTCGFYDVSKTNTQQVHV